MKGIFLSQKWPVIVISLLLLLLGLSSGWVFAQATEGTLIINACTDQNADGACDDPVDGPAPAGVEACLTDDTNCQPVPATFAGLAPGAYTAFLHFSGASQGYYPTTGRVSIDLADGAQETITLGAVYPIHPKGVAVHAQLNKVYVAFQGPLVISGGQRVKPYPFVAVIDGETDEVLYTIPGGPDGVVDPSPHTNSAGIGRGPWGVAVSGNGQFVYVGSFEDGLVSYIDPVSDTVITNHSAGSDFQPTAPTVNPVTGLVHYPDYEQGHMLILSTDPANPQVAYPFIENPPAAFSPLEVATTSSLGGYNFVTLRDAIQPNAYKFVGLPSAAPFDLTFHDINLPGGGTGTPLALGLWETTGQHRLFMTYADDPRDDVTPPYYANPDKLLLYDFDPANPTSVTLAGQTDLGRNYAEVGLVYNPAANHMLGTYAGFAYDDRNGDVAACDSPDRGGIYQVDFDGNMSDGPLPSTVVGNPPLTGGNLQWKNPFEIAINPNNGKVYVTDRCWNEFPEGNQPVGGAVLIFRGTTEQPTPTPTVTTTPTITTTPTVTATPTITTTPTPTVTTTPEPGQINLVMSGPASVALSEIFSVTVVAENVPDPGLYGAQFEINFDPSLLSISNLQPNPNLSFVVRNEVDNTLGRLRLVASRQGYVPGLTGDVTLLTFSATATNTSGLATLTFSNEKIGNAEAQALTLTSQSYTVLIGDFSTPTPTPETPTATPETPTPTPETPTATPETPTATPGTPTPTPETPTATPETPTVTPGTPTPTPETPTATPETPTTTPETPTPTPETPTATPETPTPTPATPTTATVSGQVILNGRANNDWSGAAVQLDNSVVFSATTEAGGNFSLADVPSGAYTSLTADAPGYLPALCNSPIVTAPLTTMANVSLFSGDVNDDGVIDIVDGTTVGVGFGTTGSGLPEDINRDGEVDILDIILVSLNFGQAGPQTWTCQ